MKTKLALGVALVVTVAAAAGANSPLTLESDSLAIRFESASGDWSLLDKTSGVRWPSAGEATVGVGQGLSGGAATISKNAHGVRVTKGNGATVVFRLIDSGRSVTIRYEAGPSGELRVLRDALTIAGTDAGYVIVPCREGLLIPADNRIAFRHVFGTSEYEGCHMNMLGLVKRGSGLIVHWDDAYVRPEVERSLSTGRPPTQRLSTSLALRRAGGLIRLTPLGSADWNTIAAEYRRLADKKGLAVTLGEKIRRNPRAESLVGAANVKLWTCLARRMNEESTREESVAVRWTFDEAAQIAEHLKNDLRIDRCLFILGGWTEGGYDCRHPDDLPANRECGGNERLAQAIRRIQSLGYIACLHDNYQDMYRDAKSWNPAFLQKTRDGSPTQGGRWLGGRAFIVCATKQLDLASRPQNLPGIQKRFAPSAYFIDTTYAAGPCECFDRAHPLGRNDDIAAKSRLSELARDTFGLFGSECGREWAIPHSDFFEGLVGVSGHHYHMLQPATLGATVIPFWEMVYHDCQFCYGKYGYSAEIAAEYVIHHVLCARPLHYHSMPDHCYWRTAGAGLDRVEARPRIVEVEPAGDGAVRIRYAWDVTGTVAGGEAHDWRVFVHFGTPSEIRFQDDHRPRPAASQWSQGLSVAPYARIVRIPPSVRDKIVNVYMGLYDPGEGAMRARLPGCDEQRRVLVGRLRLGPSLKFRPAGEVSRDDRACFTRTDRGWAEGLHPVDAFLKTTHEVLGPLHAETAHQRLTRLEFLDPDRAVRRATYGQGDAATTITVNLAAPDVVLPSPRGGKVLLPRYGFVVDSPRFAAFYAKCWNSRNYPAGSLFTLRSADGRRLEKASLIRVFHGFGDPMLVWRGTTYEIGREEFVRPTVAGQTAHRPTE